jgi:hypothetical protein
LLGIKVFRRIGHLTTTIELPDSVYDQVKAQTAELGTTVDAFLVEAIND